MTKERGDQALHLKGFGSVYFVWDAICIQPTVVSIKFMGFVLDREKEPLPSILFAHSGQCLKHGETWLRSVNNGRKIWAELRNRGWKVAGEL